MTQRGLDKMQTVLNSGTQHYIYNVIKLLQPGNACCQCYDLLYVDWLVAVMFLHLINAATWVPAPDDLQNDDITPGKTDVEATE